MSPSNLDPLMRRSISSTPTTQTRPNVEADAGVVEVAEDNGPDGSAEAAAFRPAATVEQRHEAQQAFSWSQNVGQLRHQLNARFDQAAPRSRHGAGEEGHFIGVPPPPHTPGVYTRYPQGRLQEPGQEFFGQPLPGAEVIEGTDEDDHFTVSTDERTGDVVISRPDGWQRRVRPEDFQNGIIIRTQGGNDRVTIEGNVLPHIQVEGGDGDDVIDASAATGQVIIDGGRGADTLKGGRQSDLIVGGEGNDTITGGAGNDAIHGGGGNDEMDGGAGGDQLRGGEGDDRILGRSGSDFIQGGAGRDQVEAGTGPDVVYADAEDSVNVGQVSGLPSDASNDMVIGPVDGAEPTGMGATDTVHTYDAAEVDAYLDAHRDVLEIQGSADDIARTQADLGVLLGTEQGQGLLKALTDQYRADGQTLILAPEGGPGGAYRSGGMPFGPQNDRATVGSWADGTLAQPVPVLFHELVHAYQRRVGPWPEGQTVFGTGASEVGINNSERQAVGLPYMDSEGTLRAANELPFTENRLRAELGLPPRAAYGRETGEPVRWRPPPPPFGLRPPPGGPGPFPFPFPLPPQGPGAPGPLNPLGPGTPGGVLTPGVPRKPPE